MPNVYNKHHGDAPPDAVYIGRPSKWGNPFAITDECPREVAIHKHWQYLHTNSKLLQQVRTELAGLDLVCFCHPKPCHGDVYLRVANMPSMVASFHGRFRFLSNFFDSTIRSKHGILYPTAEHAYQAFKTTDLDTRRHMAKIKSPGAVKHFSRTLRLRKNWDALRVGFMLRVVRAKFFQNPSLGQLLIDTCDVPLVEGNYWGDTFWGICNGQGENNLGVLLMQVRAELRTRLLTVKR